MTCRDDIWARHDAAIARKESTYSDPETGYRVFTRDALRERGRCCGSACRHCPFQHEGVDLDLRARTIQQPAWLTESVVPVEPADVLFWSGGEGSYLSLLVLRQSPEPRPSILLTTFDVDTRREPAHQRLGLESIQRQAMRLGCPLIGVPLHSGRAYAEQVAAALALVPTPARLVFGDMGSQINRQSREATLGPVASALGATLFFPLWSLTREQLSHLRETDSN